MKKSPGPHNARKRPRSVSGVQVPDERHGTLRTVKFEALPGHINWPRPDAVGFTLLGKEASDAVRSIVAGMEKASEQFRARERAIRQYPHLLQEIRTLLVSRGYDVAELPDFLIPMALASIVPERPNEEFSHD